MLWVFQHRCLKALLCYKLEALFRLRQGLNRVTANTAYTGPGGSSLSLSISLYLSLTPPSFLSAHAPLEGVVVVGISRVVPDGASGDRRCVYVSLSVGAVCKRE